MFAARIIKKRQSPPPSEDQLLNKRDQLYGVDPNRINPFESGLPIALTYGDLNQDVMVAANEGEPDASEKGLARSSPLPNCYTPSEVIKKAQQEKLCRDEVTKISGIYPHR